MASVTETVEKAIFNYPSLFANRTQVLHHLFVKIGNGYEWVDGELVDIFDEPDLTDEEVLMDYGDSLLTCAEDAPQWRKDQVAQLRAEQDAMNAEYLHRRRNAKTLAQTTGPLAGRVYPPSGDYAHVNNYPADIREDWEAARVEILAVAEPLWEAGDHIVPPPPEPTPLSPEAAALLKRMWADLDLANPSSA